MQDSWQALFDSTAPRPSSENPLAFSELPEELRAAATGAIVAPLVHVGAIRVGGEDAASFLHGQLSNAIEDMTPAELRLAAYCNPKGRVLALFHVLRDESGFLLLTDDSVVDTVLRRLQMFVLRSKVTLKDARADVGMVAVAGPGSETLLAEAAGSPPRTAGKVVQAGDLRLLRPTDGDDRLFVVAPAAQLDGLWGLLTGGLTPVGTEPWRLLDIRAGQPAVVDATQERFVPQMLNLEPLGGIDYGKGCYPGQEVVARMHYLGRLKRRMYRIALETTDTPAPGTPVRHGDGGEAGEIVIAARAPEGGAEALAVLRIDAAEQKALTANGAPVRLLDLPYDHP